MLRMEVERLRSEADHNAADAREKSRFVEQIKERLAVGAFMTVYRGNEYVGKLIIDKKGDDWASGHMDLDLTKNTPRKGDSASTLL
jgi:hypothetical protein